VSYYGNTKKVGHKYKNVGDDPNHFHPDYFSGKVEYRHQNLERVELGYKLASDYYWSHERQLFNASTHTKLDPEIIPRIEFNDIWR